MFKKILSIMLLLCLAIAPIEALAASVKITFPGKVGMLYEDMTVTVKPKVSGVKLSKLKWETSNASVVRVSGNRVTGAKEGLAAIRASYGRVNAVCGVVVLPRSISLEVGETYSLPSHSILDYASKNSSIAKVSNTGVVTALTPGTTLVRVKHDKVALSVEVNVTGPSVPAATPAPTPAPVKQSKAASLDCADETDQIVLVEYQGNAKAVVSFHEKVNGVWTELGSTTGYVGLNGIDKVREGDKRTPTGTFNLTTPFGIKADPGANMPYTKVTKYHYWCGTSGNKYYNQLVDSRVAGRSATSSDEKLINYTGYYNYCLFIDYNASGEANKGSCIFLHCTGSKKSTSGCIAIPESYMKTAVRWVKPGAKIVIR